MKEAFSLSRKRIVIALVLIAATILGGIYFGSSPKFILVSAVLFVVGGLCKIRFPKEKNTSVAYVLYLVQMVAAAVVTAVMMQKANDVTLFKSVEKMLLNVGIALLFISIACLIQALITKRLSPAAILVSSALLMIMAVANYFVYAFRGNGISPADFLYLDTAVNFAGKYEYVVPRFMFHAVVLWLGGAFFLSGLDFGSVKSKGRACAAPLVMVLALCALLSKPILSDSIRSNHYGNNGCIINGLLLNFALETKESIIIKPQNYDNAVIQAAETEYAQKTAYESESAPNIIVIMNESFSDLRVFGELNTNVPVMPVMDSLSENTIKGYALSSTYGGMTPNSEYEFLTGNSMGFLPSFAVPFQQYVYGPVFTLEKHLEALGYSNFAAHPCEKENWSRYKVWPYLGFEGAYFVEEFSTAGKFADRISDSSLYECVIDHYNSMGDQEKRFIYTVSIQNHSPYDGVPSEDIDVYTEDYDSYEVNAYHSLIHETDRAFGELIEYFEAVEEPVIILMYGDHQAALPDEYLAQLHGGSLETLDEQMLKYKVPFIIWANYDIEEKNIELTSLNYLSLSLLEVAGLPQTAYNNFLLELQQKIPAINSQGYYSMTQGRFLEIEDAEGEEKALLEKYWCLQYNAMFDKENRSEILFPAGQ